MGSAYESIFLGDYDFGYATDSPTQSPTIFESSIIEDDITNTTSTLSSSTLSLPSLTDQQEMILSLLPVPASILSVFGSASIIYMACQSRRQKAAAAANGGGTGRSGGKHGSSWTPYTRLLIGMSCTDIIFSISYALNAFLLPKETSHRVWAIGTDTTCNFLGFFTQFSLSTMLFNGMLSFYFLLTGRYGWKNHEIAHRWYMEPMMHIISIGYPLATAIVGSVLGVYNELEMGLGCWVKDYPSGCDEPGAPPCKSPLVAYIFAGTILGFAYLSISANNVIIWRFVRKQTKTKLPSAASSIISGRPVGSRRTVRSSDNDSFASRSNPFSLKSMKLNSPNANAKESTSSDKSKTSSEICDAASMTFSQFTNRDEDDDEYGPSDEDDEELATAWKNKRILEEQELQRQRQQHKRLKLVSSQARLYVGAFFLSTIWPLLVRVLETYTSDVYSYYETKIYWILVCQNIFFPLQGFWNLLVYVRPKYLKCRREFKLESKFWALRRAMYGPGVEPTAGTYRNAGGVMIASDRKTGKVVVLQGNDDKVEDRKSEKSEVGADRMATIKDDESDFDEDESDVVNEKLKEELSKHEPSSPSKQDSQTSPTRGPSKKLSIWSKFSRDGSNAIVDSPTDLATPEPIRRLPREFISSITASVGDFSESSDRDDEEDQKNPEEEDSGFEGSVFYEELKGESNDTTEKKKKAWSWVKKKKNSGSSRSNFRTSSLEMISELTEFSITEGILGSSQDAIADDEGSRYLKPSSFRNKDSSDDSSTSSSVKRVRFNASEEKSDSPPSCPRAPFSPPGRRWSAGADRMDPKALKMPGSQRFDGLKTPRRMASLSPSSASSPTDGSSSSFFVMDECFDRMKAAMEPLNLDAPVQRPMRRNSSFDNLDDEGMTAQTV